MGKVKIRTREFNPRRAWFILLAIMGTVSVVTAATTAWLVNHPNSFFTRARDPLSVAEREGVFQNMKATLRWPSLNFGIEGSALVIEGTAESDNQIQDVIALVKKSIKADSFYIVHPYIERSDWISGRIQAMREGDWDYRRPQRSVLIVDLMKTVTAPVKQTRTFDENISEARRILGSSGTIDLEEDLRVELIPVPQK